jgi:4-amino-4-deoxy-L-arabinose transferase-like glycosyltransferase
LPFVAMILLAGMLPPLDFDVREYHLQAPKEFFQQGRITFLPHNVYADMPLGTEMLSLLAMVLADDWWIGGMAGKAVIALFTPLCAMGLFAAGRRTVSTTAGIVAALAYISVPWIVSIASGGFVEGPLCCYLFLAVYALFLWKESGRTSLVALSGYLTGAAIATKYPAVLFVFVPLAAWLTFFSLTTKKARFLRLSGVFLLAVSLGCGLWFVKNWALTGNPTYPLLYNVFGGETWNEAKDRQWNNVHRPHDFSLQTLGKDAGRVLLTSDWLSPLIVPLVVLAFVGYRPEKRFRWLLLAYIGFVVSAWWLLTHRIDRFWIPILPLAALLAGMGACWTSERWWRNSLAIILVFGLGVNFLVSSMGAGNSWFVPLAKLRHDPLWIDPWHDYLNGNAKEGRVLLVGDAGVFNLTPAILYNTCFDDCIFEQMVKGKTAKETSEALAAAQITLVYVNWSEIDRYRATYGFTDFVQPEVLQRLTAEGVLQELPPIKGHRGRCYRVVSPR